ncbi:hypothetical protein ACFC09_29440 [Streptomyces sp. NPDC056161]|uniref:hypothetical protein n=1 Tax=Streptomyces sp. NPDC056161 TaxID=3345732 RepID=UPI0035E24746
MNTRRNTARKRLALATAAVALGTGLAVAPSATAATSGMNPHAVPLGAAQASAANARIAMQVEAGNPAVKSLAEKHGWKYKTYQATACYGYKHPFWGKVRHTAGCDVAHFSLSGEVAYNGKQAWGQWISYGTGHAYGVSVKKTWLGYWNNGAKKHPYYMDLGANGHVSVKFWESHDFYLRIDVHRNGTAGLRGGKA